MAGRPPWSQPGTQGGGQTVAVSPRPEIAYINKSQNDSLSSGTTETIEVYAPTGSIYELTAIRLRADADSNWTSGSHQFKILAETGVALSRGESDYTSRVEYNYSNWRLANQNVEPSSGAVEAMQSATATENNPITIQYQNNADVAQDNTRTIRMQLEEVSY